MENFSRWYGALSKQEQTQVNWLLLAAIDRLGAKKLELLQQIFPRVSDCFNTDGLYSETFTAWARQNHLVLPYPQQAQLEPVLGWLGKPNHNLINLTQSEYPNLLRNIASPPLLLYVEGELDILSYPQIGMVGTRNPTAQGGRNAQKFAKELTMHGWVVTSGLALGVDGLSHQACVKLGSPTIAVLGSGLEHIYPRRHSKLAEAILHHGGALVSEFPLQTTPRAQNFPRRNRIISGLSYGVLVVEAARKSGSLITAGYALEQGREVFALPGPLDSIYSAGCHDLIRQGAKIVDCVAHIIEELPPISCEMSCIESIPSFKQNSEKQLKKVIELPDFLKYVDDICTPVDLVVQRAGLSAKEVTLQLMQLELEGYVKSVPGGYVKNEMGVMP